MRSLFSISFLLLLVIFAQFSVAQNTQPDYNETIELADRYYQEKDYINAKASYQMAANLKPSEEYPQEQLKKTMKLLREQMQISGRYTIVVERAEDFFENKQYDAAIAEYRKALELMPENKYPARKIDEIENIKSEIARKKKEYNSAIDQADKLLENKEYAEAKTFYQEAVVIFPDDSYAVEKITQINNTLYELEQTDREYNLAISNAKFFLKKHDRESALEEYKKALKLKPGDEELQSRVKEIEGQLKISNQYNALIEEADRLYIVKDYKNAREKYMQAADLKDGDDYASDMIVKIDEVLAKKATTEQEDFENAKTRADEYFENRELKLAKSQFEFAARLKPEKDYPGQKIAEINQMLENYNLLIASADQKLEAGKYEAARQDYIRANEMLASDPYPGNKIDEINGILTRLAMKEELRFTYDSLISQAENFYTANKYAQAKMTYQEALSLLPDQKIPAQRIEEIGQLMAKLSREKALNDKYQNLVKEGDRLFGLEEYERSRQKFEEAAALLPEEQYAAEKVNEIRQLQADIKAYRQKKEEYTKLTEEADDLLSGKKYPAAKQKYELALEVFPAEKYPKEQIIAIDSIQAEIALQKDIQQRYNATIAKADELLEEKKYRQALAEYEDALKLKPEAAYATNKKKEIDNILAEIRRKEKLEENYAADIARADSLLQEEYYELAKESYESALALKPGETYPRQQIIEIKNTLEKLAEARQKAYALAVSKGDNHFNEGEYYKAKEAYLEAGKIKPGEAYPTQQIDLANEQIAVIEKEKQEAYKQAIADADKFYNSKIYDKAIDFYSRAKTLKPDEKYPDEMMARITELINKNTLVDINTESTMIAGQSTRKFLFEPIDIKDRKNNYILVKAKNQSDNDFKVIMSYGEGDAKHGGTILRIPESEKTRDFIIRIGTQYKWFSEDNNWISLYPEGGDIEVSLIRVSKGD